MSSPNTVAFHFWYIKTHLCFTLTLESMVASYLLISSIFAHTNISLFVTIIV